MLDQALCQKARLSRDARFDGQFFIAVKTTGIFCRPICPAKPPKETNVSYFLSAIEAAKAGYRPCLRCHPDSAPGSPAWKGVNTTLDRAIRLINEGALQEGTLQALSVRLGISDRYLRQLFNDHLGVSPKKFALYQQCLFAKQLLHQTILPITEIALASGFKSVRRFNDYFKSQMELTPSQVRKSSVLKSSFLQLRLYYRPPYNWPRMQQFLAARIIPNLEWSHADFYGRTFSWLGASGKFTAKHLGDMNQFLVSIEIDDITFLKPVVHNIRRIFDLDTDINAIDNNLEHHYGRSLTLIKGLRLPGTWSIFEAGIRAILGQQVSITAARNLVTHLVHNLGHAMADKQLFPSPLSIAESNLDFLKMPQTRKQALRNLAQHYLISDNPNDSKQWLALKGIGPWTVDYARMRGLSDPDIYLGGDLGVKRAMEKSNQQNSPQLASPWRSYLTFQLWNQD